MRLQHRKGWSLAQTATVPECPLATVRCLEGEKEASWEGVLASKAINFRERCLCARRISMVLFGSTAGNFMNATLQRETPVSFRKLARGWDGTFLDAWAGRRS